MPYTVKKLDQNNMQKLQALENKLGFCVVAWENKPEPAQLSEEQIAELKAAEQDLGAVLVAYYCE